jgi:hypothetical protein
MLQDLADGKLKPNNKVENFEFPDNMEAGHKKEELMLEFDGEEVLSIDLTWTYKYDKGRFSSETGPGQDEVTDGDVEIGNIIFYIDGEDQDVKLTPKIIELAKKYVEKFIPADKK